ncbi:pectate lyase [Halocatena pleomorpha]|uniref:Pectate lyase n=1 Tax=Halocatena pleomorpha TaxID=1785090 RepID=A0A3P3RAW0_9EURY|nr:pectate lyase [Halocatena pleomorpha]RRJ30099.1 pectate lyase [Halocatena pleomorpha]
MRFDRRAFLRAVGAGAVAPAVGLFDGTATAATVVTIRGGGADIWNTEDAFHFYYETVSGDFDVRVRNTALEHTDPYAKTGIMVRESSAPKAKNVMLRRTPDGTASVQWRSGTGEETISTTSNGSDESEIDGGSLQADWLRLRRRGDVFEAYGSADGVNWTMIATLGADAIGLSDAALVGLPVTSHNVGVRCTAQLRHLSGIDPDTNRDIGDVSVTGSVGTEAGVPFVTTGDATDVTATAATLRGELTDLGGAETASCYIEYRAVPSAAWTATPVRTLREAGTFAIHLEDLTSRRYYEYRAVVETEDGDRAVGASETIGTPSRSNGRAGGNGPDSTSRIDFADGFADPAPWLDDDTPIIPVTEPTRRQLAAAVGIDGPRLIVFETSGTVDLGAQRLTVTNDELYLAGQTAPSPGITLVRGDLWIDANDCVIQHLRVRPGDANLPAESDWEPDGIRTGDGTENNVIDHCTTTWAVDENLSVGYDTANTTVSNCLVAEPLQDATHHKGDHGYGSLIGNGAENVTLAGNVWAHNYDRNPRLKEGTRTVVANNVIYHYNDGVWMDPDTEASVESNVFRRPVSDQPTVFGAGAAALADNVTTTPTAGDGITQLDDRPLWPTELDTVGSAKVVEHNLTNAGARPADRAVADERVLEQLKTGGGSYIDSQTEVGGYPALDVVTRSLTVPQSGTWAWLRAKARAVE